MKKKNTRTIQEYKNIYFKKYGTKINQKPK